MMAAVPFCGPIANMIGLGIGGSNTVEHAKKEP